MNAFLKTLAHAFMGGAAVAAAQVGTGTPITVKAILLPVLASGLTSVISLFASPPGK